MLRFGSVLLGVEDLPRALAFWQAAQDHPRVHLDLYADDQAAEVERLGSLGARNVDWDGDEDDSDFVVLEDPEGNRFCVIDKGV